MTSIKNQILNEIYTNMKENTKTTQDELYSFFSTLNPLKIDALKESMSEDIRSGFEKDLDEWKDHLKKIDLNKGLYSDKNKGRKNNKRMSP